MIPELFAFVVVGFIILLLLGLIFAILEGTYKLLVNAWRSVNHFPDSTVRSYPTNKAIGSRTNYGEVPSPTGFRARSDLQDSRPSFRYESAGLIRTPTYSLNLRWKQRSSCTSEFENKGFEDLKWILTRDDDMCDRVILFLTWKIQRHQFFGLDVEWDPVYQRGQTPKTALIQLGLHTGHCLLYQVSGKMRLPLALTELLCDPRYLKVGVGIKDQDTLRLREDFGVQVYGAMDLRAIAPPAKKMSLACLSQDHLDITLNKEHRFTKWSNDELSIAEQAYAAKDVYVSTLLARRLTASCLEMNEEDVQRNDILRAKRSLEETVGVRDWWRRTSVITGATK